MSAFLTSIALLLAASSTAYRIDVTRYFPNPQAEAQSRSTALAQARAFNTSPVPANEAGLLVWLQRYDALLKSLERHDIYVYLRAEEDDQDVDDAKADESLGDAEDLVTNHLTAVAGHLGKSRIHTMMRASSLAAYRYLLDSALAKTAHQLTPSETHTVELAVTPVLDSAAASYKALRKSDSPLERRQDAYAALLISIASARNGVASLRGFRNAADAAYFERSLEPASVERTLVAVRASNSYARYLSVAERAPKPGFTPAPLPISDAIGIILAAERPMGQDYSDAYTQLLDPANARFELCTAPACDRTGFSVGFAGVESGLYFGGYERTVSNVRAIAHESGHAVHRGFMSRYQPIAAYNRGPAFMFESFAIFNELLLLDDFYKRAPDGVQRAYYLNYFLQDATFQVFGSAKETELESAIYRGVGDRTIRTAADLDALTGKIFARYDPNSAGDAATQFYWARDRLFFTDPLYDVNYLYAGLLALSYFADFERDPRAFSARYVALLKNGFNDSPARLERDFLGIDLTDEPALVGAATALIDDRTQILSKLYENSP